ncbi:potassium voltage-gated channel protein Shaw-like isoform X1 [Haliotis rufescens]|uniref:potassium voltage-gated channel protein Shaw-like isoform X1 n=1 Tax=Haliotis rufescens TaxID=6454 RepID=UPI001EAFDAA9|nr:potassium voltage-gated channel protein Shaw-like isoform X1 [Haliotis rufescens]
MTKERIKLCVGGLYFTTSAEVLSRFPETKLGQISPACQYYDGTADEYYFDRDPDVFSCILNMYRTSELHLPSNICGNAIRRELDFWEIPENQISECCWLIMFQVDQGEEINKDLAANFGKSSKEETGSPCGKVRDRLWKCLDQPNYSRIAKIWNTVFMILVAVSAILYCLETMFEFRELRPGASSNSSYRKFRSGNNLKIELLMFTKVNDYVYVIDVICLCIFTVELILHFLSCAQKRKFMKRFLTWVDIVSISGGWSVLISEIGFLHGFVPQTYDMFVLYVVLRSFYIFRLFRFLRLSERFTGLKVIFLAINRSKSELILLMSCFTIIATVFGSIQYYCEFENNAFDTIPISIWWAVVTMTTVGYGDYVPSGVCGYLVGSVCSLLGILVIPMPIAVIAANFNDFYKRNQQRQQRLKKQKRPPDPCSVVKVNPC